MATGSAARRWFRDSFIADEQDIARKLGAAVTHPLKFFNVSQLGFQTDEFIADIAPSFNALEWDVNDVKNEQVNLLQECFPESLVRLNRFRAAYLQGEVELEDVADLVETAPADVQKRIHSLLPWRQRAASTFVLRLYGDEWNVEQLPQSEFRQQVDASDSRSIPRHFQDCSTELTENETFKELIVRVADLVREVEPSVAVLRLTAHQIRVIARRGFPGAPCPEGTHQDGTDYVLTGLVIQRKNITGGTSYVLSEDGETSYLETTLEPGQGIFHADAASPFWHFATPCVFDPASNELSGFRDILGFDLHIEKRSGSGSTRGALQNPDSVEGGIGAFTLPFHREMVADVSRVRPFQYAIESVCKDKIVIESGTGTGIMSLFAARAGAKHVYAVEIDPRIAHFAEKNIQQAGYADKVTLLRKDIREVTLEDIGNTPAEVVIAENLATWLVTEPQLVNMNTVNQNLAAPDAVRIPEKMTNYVELVTADFDFYDLITMKTYYFEFTGIPKPTMLSDAVVVNSWDFAAVNQPRVSQTVSIMPNKSGLVNALRFTSFLQVLGEHTFSESDTLLPPVVVPLAEPVRVIANQAIVASIEFESFTCWEALRASITITN